MWNIPSHSNPHIRDNILDMLNTLGKWLQKGATLSISLLRQLQAWICEVLQSTCSPLIRNVLDQPSYLPKFHNLGGRGMACVAAIGCGVPGLLCMHLSSHPTWRELQTRHVIPPVLLVGITATTARHLDVSSTCDALPQQVLVAGVIVGLSIGGGILSCYYALKRAKIPVYSVLGTIGGFTLVVTGAAILADA